MASLEEDTMLMQAIAAIVRLLAAGKDDWEGGEPDNLSGWIASSTDWAA